MSRSEMLFDQIKVENKNILELAEALEMDRSTFYRKAKEPNIHFTVNQAVKLSQILHMCKDRFEAIFF